MSIYAITCNKKDVSVRIPWLHQCYCLDKKGQAYSILEFIIGVNEGVLQEIEIYVPCNIAHLEDGTRDLVDANNKHFYTSEFKILKSPQQKNRYGRVVLDGIEADVGKILLNSEPTIRGSKINVTFVEGVNAKEKAVVRIRYDKAEYIDRKLENKCWLTLRYYTSEAASVLGIDKARVIDIENLFIWLMLPSNATLLSTSPEPCRQTVIKKPPDYYRVFFGSAISRIWKENETRLGLMWKTHKRGNKPVLYPWTTMFFNCSYAIQKAGLKEEPEKAKLEYKIYTNETIFLASKEKTEKIRNKKSEYALFIESDRAEVFVFGRPAADLKKAFMQYSMLIYFLRKKGVGGRYEEIFNNVWAPEKAIVDDKERAVEQAKYRLNNFLRKYKLQEIARKNRIYRLPRDFKFCLIEEKHK